MAQATINQNVDKLFLSPNKQQKPRRRTMVYRKRLKLDQFKVTKAEAERIVALGDKFIANSPETESYRPPSEN
ncbi:MAG: hypothetical protein ACLUDU_10365 [Butyricimonas faecihominis]